MPDTSSAPGNQHLPLGIAQSLCAAFGFLLVFALLVFGCWSRSLLIGWRAGFDFDILTRLRGPPRARVRRVVRRRRAWSDRARFLRAAQLLNPRDDLVGLQVAIDDHAFVRRIDVRPEHQ